MEKRVCKKCNVEKVLNRENFYLRKEGYYTHACKECLSEGQKKYKKRKVYPKNYYRERSVENKYNLSKLEYDRIYKEQNGKCAICATPEFELKKKLCVDHDHRTGKVRGLLCTLCNQGLGSFKDNQTNLENAMYYLILHK